MIEVDSVSRSFGRHRVVDRLGFNVKPGEVLGFLGPNGAGKTTTMRMITGYLQPDRGSIRVCGHDVIAQGRAARGCIGYLPEGAPAWADMTVNAFLRFLGEARGLKGAHLRERMTEVSRLVELEPVREQRIETLSKGFRRRVGLAQALLHDPSVLVLDEPTDGLDPNQKHQVRGLIRSLASDRTVIVSTHILEEVEAVCTRALIISQGRRVVDGTPAELLRRSRYHQAIQLRLKSPCPDPAALSALPGVAELEQDESGQALTLFPEAGASIHEPVSTLVRERGWPVETLYVEPGRLDDVFRKLTRGEAA